MSCPTARPSLALVALAATALVLTPEEARACGGTFCDTGPNSMPVDQTGETILFVMDPAGYEAHIQIQYDPNTDAAKFAWVVPIQVLPEFSVGSQPLFDALLGSTVPAYGFSTNFTCNGGSGGFSTGGGGTGGDGGTDGGGSTGGGGPDVVYQATVGAFDVVVLQGGTSMEVMDWLATNGYQQDPNAEPILGEYLAEGYMFAAFKLVNGVGIDSIHPVVLRFPSTEEACVPIRLTRIAAQDDMRVRTFFLGNARAVPSTYRHVLVNPLKLDWPSFASNYNEVITMAADSPMADGHAFVTEFAGPSSTIPTFSLWNASWSATPFATLDVKLVVQELEAQGLAYCDFGQCSWGHPLVPSLLHEYVPVPPGVMEGDFYDCLSCYEGLIDPMAWDPAAFAAAFQERLVDPGQHAVDLLGTWPYLTRMFTTISPQEMTEDPFFTTNPDLPEVNLTSSIATQDLDCNNDSVWTLPNGQQVFVPSGTSWPAFPDEMPWVEEVEQMPAIGAPMVLLDQRAKITAELAKWNCMFDFPNADACGSSGSSSGGSSGSSATSGSSSSGTDSAGATDATATSGCGCTTPAGSAGAFWLLGFTPLVRRRRR
jgi:uncharacterized protein (TIGR03382 family)